MRRIVLTEALMLQMLRREDVLREFPHLRKASKRVRSGREGCCGRKAASYGTLKQLKLGLAGLPGNRKAALKQLLKADELVLYTPGPRGPSKIVI